MDTNNIKCGFCDGPINMGFPTIWYDSKPYHESCYINVSSIGNFFLPGETITIPKNSSDDSKSIKLVFDGSKTTFYKKRDSWNVYFMKLADLVSTRSTCDRKHCGSVITKDNKIIGTGYNGSEPGKPHCDDVGHFMVNNSCKRTLHAEVNAINQAKERFPSLEGCKLYTNTFPCWNCYGEIYKSGIREIYFKDEHSGYKHDDVMEKISKLLDIKIEKVSLEGNS